MNKIPLFQAIMMAGVLINPTGRIDVMGSRSRSLIKDALAGVPTEFDRQRLRKAQEKRERRAARNARNAGRQP